MSRIVSNPIALVVIAILLLILIGSTFAIVPETKQAVIVRFGEPQRILNRYRPNEAFGQTGAGLAARIPFVEQIVWIDKRIQSIDMENQQVLSTDQLRLQVDAFARYRIVDPLRMYIVGADRGEGQRAAAADPRLGAAQRARPAAVRRPAQPRARPDDGQYPERAQPRRHPIWRADRRRPDQARRPARRHAARFRLSSGCAPRASRRRARSRRRGCKQAQIIRAEADAEAAATYAGAFNQDPDFYDFYRAMQSYQTSFLSPGTAESPRGRTSIILSPNNDYLRQFRGQPLEVGHSAIIQSPFSRPI